MRSALPVLAALLLATGCGDGRPAEPPAPVSIPFRDDGRMTIYHGNEPVVDVAIEIADDDSSRTRGLMQREEMPDRSAMLFVFPREEPQSFWMANTPLSLDLLFLDAAGRIVSISRYTRPLSTEPVPSGLPAQYVVEFEAGFVDTWGIVEGDSTAWVRNDAE